MSEPSTNPLRELAVIESVAKKRGLALPSSVGVARARALAAIRERYADNPVDFCSQVLGETITSDVGIMMESVRDNRITVAMSANAVGKTHGSARVAVWFFTMWDNSQVYTTAAPPEKNLKLLLWGEIDAITDRHSWLFRDSRLLSTHVERKKKELKSFITGVSIPLSGTPAQRIAKFSGKHAPHLLFIVDEGDAVPDEVYKGIESCMSSDHARLLIMLNPRAKDGYASKLIEESKANVVVMSAFNHPNVITGRNVIPGAVSREGTLRRINQWSRLLVDGEEPDQNCFRPPDFLIGESCENPKGGKFPPLMPGWREVKEPDLWYMVLAAYPPTSEFQLIPRHCIDAARARWDEYVSQHGNKPPKDVRPVLGLDVAELGPDDNVAALRYNDFLAPMRKWRGIDPDASASLAAELYKEERCTSAFVDGIGVGAAVAPALRRMGCRGAQSVKVSERPTKQIRADHFERLRDQLAWEVRLWLDIDGGAMLPPDDELIQELLVYSYKPAPVSGKTRVTRKDVVRERIGRSPNKFDALALTFAPPRGFKLDFI